MCIRDSFSSAAFNLFFDSVQRLLAGGVSLVIEAAFHNEYARRNLEQMAGSAALVHIAMNTPMDISLRRYRQRAEAGHRHPAHNDLRFATKMEDGGKDLGVYQLVLPCPSLSVDGASSWVPAINEIVDFVQTHR